MAFPCHHVGCTCSYQRREHLLRHHKVHANLRLFACQVCPAAFNRKDLLNRHAAKSHNSATSQDQPGVSRRREPKPSFGNGTDEGGIAEPELERGPYASFLRGSMSIALGAELAKTSNRNVLERLYFCEFHPHWPILHQNTFQSRPQPDELRQAVWVAGLWMMDTVETRPPAESYHDELGERMCAFFNKIDQHRGFLKAPRPEFLALFQTIMVTIILCTYRGAKALPKAMVTHKRLTRLFEHMGVLDRKRIDAENPLDSIAQEQYQRLALVLFKVFVHVNALLIAHLPRFRLLDHLDPAMLQVRVPSPQRTWDTPIQEKVHEDGNRAFLVGDLITGEANCLVYQALMSIAAWDFSTGTVFGCFMEKPPGEIPPGLMRRVTHFSFWHLKTRSGKWAGVLTL